MSDDKKPEPSQSLLPASHSSAKDSAALPVPFDAAADRMAAVTRAYERADLFNRLTLQSAGIREATLIASRHAEAMKFARIIPTEHLDRLRFAMADASRFKHLTDAVTDFEKRFRAVTQSDWARFSKIAAQVAKPAWLDQVTRFHSEFERQLAAINKPFIDIQNHLRSLRGFGELAAIGSAVRLSVPFEPALVSGLRTDLGDWREAEVDAAPLLDDPAARILIYKEHGFNEELTDFPAEGFNQALTVTEIDLGAVGEALAPPSVGQVPEFNQQAYQWLFVLERELRKFIMERLSQADGGSWERRLPPEMHDKWRKKKADALTNGEGEQELIHYADFTDYVDIILGRANWRDFFQPTFKREEAVREGFNRLRPIRLVTAHMRVLTAEEWLVLNIEARRFLRAIGVL